MPSIPSLYPLCMDGRMLVDGKTGVARYAAGLAATLPMLGGQAMVLRDRGGGRAGRWLASLATGPARVVQTDDTEAGGLAALAGRQLFRAAQAHFTLTGRFRSVVSDCVPGVMHWTYPVPMHMDGWANIYTVHDVIPLDRPEWTSVDPHRLRAILRRIAATASRIVTVSEASRARILAHVDIDPGKVVNCYQAVPVAPPRSDLPLPAGLRPGGYLLYYGSAEPRKNLPRLIAAYLRSGVAYPLVVVGVDPSDTRSAPDGRVLRLPWQLEAMLDALRQDARAILFPSLAEGFGLPIVEAMAAGVPVLTSSTGAMREIAGDAALLVDAEDVDRIAAGIGRISGDPELRRTLRDAGRLRAARFGQARFAARLRGVYRAAIADLAASW